MSSVRVLPPLEPYNELIQNLVGLGFEIQSKNADGKFAIYPLDYNEKKDRYLIGWKNASGLHLCGPENGDGVVKSPNLLNFNFSQASAAKFVEIKGERWLVRDDRVSKRDGRQSPEIEDPILIESKEYQLVTRIDDVEAFENIVRFHESRERQLKEPEILSKMTGSQKAFNGKNGGSVESFSRNSADVDPQHKLVVDALHAAIPASWTVVNKNKVAPDLLVKCGNRTILFEVKPSKDFSNMCHAVGQLKVYSEYLGSPELVYVAYGLPLSFPDCEKLLNTFGIKFVKAVRINEEDYNFEFPNLTQVLE